MKIKSFYAITAAGLTASVIMASGGCGGSSHSSFHEKKYNVMLVITDQEHYFSEYPQGSNYAARKLLAEMGTTFEKHYVCSNMSTSSRSTIFTGHHVPHTGMSDNTDFPWQSPMSDTIRTIGDIMRDSGYYSALKGKWHLGGTADITGETQATITDLNAYGFSDWGGTDYIGALRQGNQIDPVIAAEASDWLNSKGSELNNDGKPFFLVVNMINPHDIMDYDITGYQSPKLHLGGKPSDDIYNTAYNVEIPATYSLDLTSDDIPSGIKLYNKNWSVLTGSFDISSPNINDLWKDFQNYYFNCIQDNDNNLQKIIATLKANNMLENTIIIFTSDHGEMHGSHGLKGKGGFVYENNIHVPMIIIHPDFEGGRKVSELTSHIDIAATLADIGGRLDSEDLPGHSMIPLMNGGKSQRDGALFCYEMLSMSVPIVSWDVNAKTVNYNFLSADRGMVRGIITKDGYKFARYFSPLEFNLPSEFDKLFASNDVQLFNLNNDPEELNNLAGSADRIANNETIMSFNDRLNALIKSEVGDDTGTKISNTLKTLQESQKKAQ